MSTNNELKEQSKVATSETTVIRTFRFLDYKVYQDSKYWFQEIASLRGILEANTELWGQLRKNISSVIMNITASTTKLPQEAKRYLGNAIAAANKSVACLDLACDGKAISPEEFQMISNGYKGIIIQLKKLIKSFGSQNQGFVPSSGRSA